MEPQGESRIFQWLTGAAMKTLCGNLFLLNYRVLTSALLETF
jgi:hypothetical protein